MARRLAIGLGTGAATAVAAVAIALLATDYSVHHVATLAQTRAVAEQGVEVGATAVALAIVAGVIWSRRARWGAAASVIALLVAATPAIKPRNAPPLRYRNVAFSSAEQSAPERGARADAAVWVQDALGLQMRSVPGLQLVDDLVLREELARDAAGVSRATGWRLASSDRRSSITLVARAFGPGTAEEDAAAFEDAWSALASELGARADDVGIGERGPLDIGMRAVQRDGHTSYARVFVYFRRGTTIFVTTIAVAPHAEVAPLELAVESVRALE